jgi:hypothetical protein
MRRILAIFCALASLGFASPVLAQSAPNYQPNAGAGLQRTAESTGAYDTEGSSLIATTYNILQGILGTLAIVLVVLLVYAGILYLTAQGEAARVEKAKSIITSAVIGIVITVLAYAAVTFLVTLLIGKPLAEDQGGAAAARDAEIARVCTTLEGCNDPICLGVAECAQIRQSAAEQAASEDPCERDVTSDECWAQINDITAQQCREDPELPICCTIFDPEGPLFAAYCEPNSRVIQNP